MSKPSRRPNREAIKAKIKERKKLAKILREQQEKEGLHAESSSAIANRKSPYKTEDEERMARNELVTDSMKILRAKLPVLLKRLKKIPDPRNPKKIKHKLTVILLYGMLTFVLQMSSRREANREMTHPVFMDNLKLFLPELEDLPHNDTLMRLLARIDVHEIENAQIDLVNKLIRNKKFKRYLIDNCYTYSVRWFAKVCQGLAVERRMPGAQHQSQGGRRFQETVLCVHSGSQSCVSKRYDNSPDERDFKLYGRGFRYRQTGLRTEGIQTLGEAVESCIPKTSYYGPVGRAISERAHDGIDQEAKMGIHDRITK